MSVNSVNLLKERVLRAAFAAADELEASSGLPTKAGRELTRAVKALREETWRTDEAPSLIKELLHLVELNPEPTSMLGAAIRQGKHETVLRAKAFLGERKVDDNTQPTARPRRGILRRHEKG